jgi:EAL domain-containing protein (putative c-di-GMP-specific phosphodiesterase class I)
MIYPKTLTFSDGAILFAEGEPGDCAYYIEDGAVDLISAFDGKEALIGTLSAGDLTGEMALLDQQVRSATAKVRGSAKVIQIHASHITERLDNADPLIAMLLKAVLQRFRETRRRLHLVTDQDRLHVIEDASQDDGPSTYKTESQLVSTSIKHEIRLHNAFEKHEFELFAQPIVLLKSRSILGAEGLLRWRHPTMGLKGPGEVIEAAERNGLIVDLGYWLIEQGCNILINLDKLCADQQKKNPLQFISINVSPRQLKEPNFTEQVQNILHASKIDPHRIKLEITESAMLEQPQLAEIRLRALKAIGVRIALDDFGTGYSSLSTIMDYPIDTIKIDRSFVIRMNEDVKALNIIKIILSLANTLKFDVIVEGIETEMQANLLTQLGCQLGQGYLFSKPLSLTDLITFIGIHN